MSDEILVECEGDTCCAVDKGKHVPSTSRNQSLNEIPTFELGEDDDSLDEVVIDVSNLDLSQLFNYFGSDKDRNGYAQCYHTLFDKLRDQEKVRLMEIGIGTMTPGLCSSMVGYSLPGYRPGGSLRAWKEYFPNGEIVGVDIALDTQFEEERIVTHLCDSASPEASTVFKREILNNKKFDIIIDDGWHLDKAQLATLSNFYEMVKDGGFYIIEDIYPGSALSNTPDLIKRVVGNDPFFFVGVKNNICVIYKSPLKSNRANY